MVDFLRKKKRNKFLGKIEMLFLSSSVYPEPELPTKATFWPARILKERLGKNDVIMTN